MVVVPTSQVILPETLPHNECSRLPLRSASRTIANVFSQPSHSQNLKPTVSGFFKSSCFAAFAEDATRMNSANQRESHTFDPDFSHSIHSTSLSGQGPPDVASEAFWWSRSAEWHKAIDMAFNVDAKHSCHSKELPGPLMSILQSSSTLSCREIARTNF